MPTFENGTSLATVRSRLNTAIIDAELGRGSITTVAGLIADTSMGYTTAAARYVTTGQRLTIAGFDYEVAASGASDHHVTTAGGVKLYVLPGANGKYPLLAFGAPTDGTSDCTAFFIKAAGTGGRTITVPAGTFLCEGNSNAGIATADTFNLPSNTTIEGIPGATIIRPFDKTARGAFSLEGGDSGSGPDDDLIENVTLRGLTFRGWVNEDGHFEQASNVNFSGVNGLLIENCRFEAARGDGLTIASGNSGDDGAARHNYNVTIRGCVFDGEVNGVDGGRNAISVIDVDDLLIEDCTFKTWSRSDMPGSIDLEPDTASQVIKNVTIRNNRFSDCEGNRGHIAIVTDNVDNANVANISIGPGNTFTSNNAVSIYTDEDAVSFPTIRHNIAIFENSAVDVEDFVQKIVGHVYGLYIENNVVRYATTGANRILIGDGTATWSAKDIRLIGNRLSVNAEQAAVLTANTEDVLIQRNIISGATTSCVKIGLNSPATTSARISIIDNTWLGTPSAGAVEHEGTRDVTNNVYLNNINPNNLTHSFRALRTDFGGDTFNVVNETTLPSAFPYGESVTYISSRAVISANDSGMLRTSKATSIVNTATVQTFIPNYDATYLDDIYFRKSIDASTWGAWFRVTGV